MIRRILVGYDGSNEAQEALRTAIELARDLNGRVRVLLVVHPPYAETSEELVAALEAEREMMSQRLTNLLTNVDVSGIERRVEVVEDPARALTVHVREHGFDLLVVGARAGDHLTYHGIGHSLDTLLRMHPCPILVV